MSAPRIDSADSVLDFWFAPARKAKWFKSDPAFDAEVRQRLGALHEDAVAGRLESWRAGARGCVALVILLDQVPRNVFRGTARAFATDGKARAVAAGALDRGLDQDPSLTDDMRLFLYVPLEHSEALADQRTCVRLIEERIGAGRYLDYARRHLEVIERFGRFPGRNAALGRDTTPEEAEFLAQNPGF